MKKIAIIGLGYVGLPLAIKFSEVTEVIGYDINKSRINELRHGIDITKETTKETFNESQRLNFTDSPTDLREAEIFIVTVPTPVGDDKVPDLNPLELACETLSGVLKSGDIVIFESTVYPGVTQDICAPLLESLSGLRFNEDFFVGYSPERINPGDKTRELSDIIKITSGSNKAVADEIDDLYKKIIKAGTWKVSDIKIAEAAKVIENTQRDVNIALVNEFSLIFDRIGIDTHEVLDAACTKWNFLDFRPGLVGGHCIGVDPYYLSHKAISVGYHPELIMAGRRLNDEMPRLLAQKLVKQVIKIRNSRCDRVLILGATFKENCPDVRNTKIIDFAAEIEEFGFVVDIFDPIADSSSFQRSYGRKLLSPDELTRYAAVVLAVPHTLFLEKGVDWMTDLKVSQGIFYDLKSVFNLAEADLR